MKDIKLIRLNRTQLFLRFLKQNNLYSDYLKEIHDAGKAKLIDALLKAEFKNTNDILAFIRFNLNEMFWRDMMNWYNNDLYSQNNHNRSYWDGIDRKWTKFWLIFRHFFDGKPQDTVCLMTEANFKKFFLNEQ